ncbi:flagellar protein FliS [Rhodopirellula sallentina]|uniref:Flagellar protein FliS n=1 Tax=Rhodopirellula sallentina SM41 TaxID=1263870 RepID=M5TYY5_9BACT|nr:flagellar protein FliS [Rhodopirellula sallentina SM41]
MYPSANPLMNSFQGNERRIAPPTPIDSLSGPSPAGFGRRSSDTYLESMIATASPAKLRLMLIERSVEVARHLAGLWRESPGKRGTNEHSLKLFELLSELLSGVTDDKVEVCRTVADMYVFLCQHLIAAEENGDATMIDEIRLVLETEAETWRMVCMQENGATASQTRAADVLARTSPGSAPAPPVSGGLNLQG